MDVTNPGLVNVADQVAGRPDTSVPALSVPREDDALVAAAGEAQPAAPLATVSVFPTPAEASAGDSQYPAASQSFGQVPGTAPAYAPFPPPHDEVAVGLQDVPQVGTAEFTVAGPRTSIQTNQGPETARDYAVTSVLDADTGGPVVEPATSVSGTFSAVFDEATKLRFASPATFPASLVDGVTVGITCPTRPSYQGAGQASGVVSASGAISAASSTDAGASTTFSSDADSLAGVLDDAVAVVSGAGAPYDGAHRVSDVTDLAGTFDAVRDAGGGAVAAVSPTSTGLAGGELVTMSGAYAGPHEVTDVTDYAGAFTAAADAGGGVVTFTMAAAPAGMANGQFVTLAGAVYAETCKISNVTPTSFDCSPAGGFAGTDAGTLQSRTFSFVAAFSSDYAGTWTCRTFKVAVAYAAGATGSWVVANFDLPGTYVASAAGTWDFFPTDVLGTTRYRLGLAPADLDNFGVVVQDREIVFADPTLTAANSGASRVVQFATSGWIVVGKYDQESDVPVLTTPQVGDQLTLYVQREGSEMFVEQLGHVATQDLWTLPPPAAAAPVQAGFPTQAPVNASTGAQPGAPVIGRGVEVPTAVTVQVADQATSIGLPANVFA